MDGGSTQGIEKEVCIVNTRTLVALVSVLALSANAFAIQTYSFAFYTNNGNYNDSSDVKLFVDVDSYDAATLSFNFRNDSTIAGVISALAIEQNPYLSGVCDIGNHSGVQFTTGNVPNFGGLTPAFNESIYLSAKADAPAPTNGLGKGEYLTIRVGLTGGSTYDDVISGLERSVFRIGLHVQALPDGSSEKALIDRKPPIIAPIPAPAAAYLGLLGLGCVVSLRKKFA
jgi:hypothetical protein